MTCFLEKAFIQKPALFKKTGIDFYFQNMIFWGVKFLDLEIDKG